MQHLKEKLVKEIKSLNGKEIKNLLIYLLDKNVGVNLCLKESNGHI